MWEGVQSETGAPGVGQGGDCASAALLGPLHGLSRIAGLFAVGWALFFCMKIAACLGVLLFSCFRFYV